MQEKRAMRRTDGWMDGNEEKKFMHAGAEGGGGGGAGGYHPSESRSPPVV